MSKNDLLGMLDNLTEDSKLIEDKDIEKKENSDIPEWIYLNSQVRKVIPVSAFENKIEYNFSKDAEAVRSYFINEVNAKTQFYLNTDDKIKYLTEDVKLWKKEIFEQYTKEEVNKVFDFLYEKDFRFPRFMGAFKFYNDYALKEKDDNGKIIKYYERYEDRLAINCLEYGEGDVNVALDIAESLIAQDFTPATPTLLNTGLVKGGERVSCFLIHVGDSMNDIARGSEQAKQLSKLGGGVGISLNNIRAKGEQINGKNGVAKGIVPLAKMLDYDFRYADQEGQRQGAGAVYLSVHHADFEDLLDTKKINASEDTRLVTLSIGAILTDKFMEAVINKKPVYQFYPYNVFKETGVEFEDIVSDMDNWYDKLVENPNIKKKKIEVPEAILDMIADRQSQSGYPYIMFIDNVNKANTHPIKVKFSNLCSEILQPSETSMYADYDKREDDKIGLDISCNLSSGNIKNMMDNKTIEKTVVNAMRIMNSVSDKTNISHVPAVARANNIMHSVGLGMMNLHGYLASNYITYGSPESIEFVDVFFNIVNYYSLKYSMEKAKDTGETFYKFEDSTYANGKYFENRGEILPKSDVVKELFEGIYIPTDKDWEELEDNVKEYGVYNSNRLAVAPNGSTAYLMSATPSVTPIREAVESRTYGNSNIYFPMPDVENLLFMYEGELAYDLDNFDTIDLIATIQKHIDQGISFESCVKSSYIGDDDLEKLLTTKNLKEIYLYAWKRGIKTLYYTRTYKTQIAECESCVV